MSAARSIPRLKRDSIRRECEESLRRLKLDAIDLYQIHWPRPEEDLEEGWATLAELQREGKVRWIGVSNYSVAQMQQAEAIAPISSLQPPYSLIRPEVENEILPYCQEHNIGVIVYSPMYSGLLSGKMTAERIKNMPADDWRQRDPEFQMPRLEQNLQLVSTLAEIGKQHEVEPGVVAIAWTLRHPGVTGAIVGARRPSQVDGIFPSTTLRLSPQEIEQLNGMISIKFIARLSFSPSRIISKGTPMKTNKPTPGGSSKGMAGRKTGPILPHTSAAQVNVNQTDFRYMGDPKRCL